MMRPRLSGRRNAVRNALLAAALLVAGCVPLGQQFQSPEVTVETLRINRIADGKADLLIGLRLFNPNAYALPVERIEVDLTIDARPAATGRSVHVEPLSARGEAKVELSGRVDVGAIATAMVAAGSLLPVEYVVKGTIVLNDGTALPFTRKGRVPVARFDRGFGPRPQ
jgi:LEA14-like dessication related protein